MDQERLSSLAIIQMNSIEMNSIKIEKIIDIFASKKEEQILHRVVNRMSKFDGFIEIFLLTKIFTYTTRKYFVET